MAPSTPPPPRSVSFAALTIASTSSRVMSPVTSVKRERSSSIVAFFRPIAGDTDARIGAFTCVVGRLEQRPGVGLLLGGDGETGRRIELGHEERHALQRMAEKNGMESRRHQTLGCQPG